MPAGYQPARGVLEHAVAITKEHETWLAASPACPERGSVLAFWWEARGGLPGPLQHEFADKAFSSTKYL